MFGPSNNRSSEPCGIVEGLSLCCLVPSVGCFQGAASPELVSPSTVADTRGILPGNHAGGVPESFIHDVHI